MENNWLDIQHRGFSAYLQETEGSDACKQLKRAILSAQESNETLDTVFYDCVVKTDWIQQIETAMPFLENAVREGRQFILRQGEIVPIERVKRVSKASVEHLSKHSELITTEPKPGQDLIPDKLYMTENIGTYTVYENRFLYMLLCYLHDFLAFRYQKITSMVASFSANLTWGKEFSEGSRKIRYHLDYSEVSQGVDGVVNPKTQDAVSRIRTLLQAVELLLKTGLMKEVSVAPMLQPPISRTNVLLHDPNFKVAFELYTYLVAYTEDGFAKEERFRSDSSFSKEMREDFASLVAMTSYLSYRRSGLFEELEARRLAEDARQKALAEQAKAEKLQTLKESLGEVPPSAAEYILALEERNALLETQNTALVSADALREAAQQKLRQLQEDHEKLQEESAKQEADLLEQLGQSREQCNHAQDDLVMAQAHLEQTKLQLTQAQAKFDQDLDYQKQLFQLEYEALEEKYRLLQAQDRAAAYLADPNAQGEIFLSKEAFARLEAEYAAYTRFFEQQWKQAKKQIRKDLLWASKNK